MHGGRSVCVWVTQVQTHMSTHRHTHLALTPAACPPDFFSNREESEAVAIIIALLSLISVVPSQACRGAGGS